MSNILRSNSIIAAIFIAFLSLSAEAGPFYVVVGSFHAQGDARRFANGIREHYSEASFKFDAQKKVYHVHVMETDLHREAETFRNTLRKENGFENAWVYTDFALGAEQAESHVLPSDDYVSLELFTGGSILLGSADNSYLSITNSHRKEKDSVRLSAGHTFTFTAETAAGRSIGGDVLLVDKKGKVLSSFKTGEEVILNARDGGVMMLICQVDGYSAEMKILPLGRFSDVRDLRRRPDNVWELRFQVRKLEIDEVNLEYHEMFHPDAAILQSGAKNQIDDLLTLLRKNPGWRVVFNIHCNRGVRRKIAVPGQEGDYFTLDGAKEISATDSKLTDARGKVLKDYLVSNGVDSERITLMGWGSVNLLVPDTADNAEVNDRVEVEVGF